MNQNSPTYAAAFRCIGPACEDTCCKGWDIPVDRTTYLKYKQFPPGPLRSAIDRFVFVTEIKPAASTYAQIFPSPDGFCSMLDEDKLCGIHKQYGPELLPATCSMYPRSLSYVDGQLEGTLSLSCPEAVRNILFQPGFLHSGGDLFSGDFRTDNTFYLGTQASGETLHRPTLHFHAIRALLCDLVQDRSRPIWQRLLAIGAVCKRLSDVSTASDDAFVPRLLDDFRQVLLGNAQPVDFDSLPASPRLRIELIVSLSAERIHDPGCGRRFQDTFWTFTEGIGSSTAITPDNDIRRFILAEQTTYNSFCNQYPEVIENYLLSYLYKHLFPFGRAGSDQFTARSIFEEWLLLATQFAWVEGLLIGVAAARGPSFGQDDVVHTVQSYTRAVEHYPAVLDDLLHYVKSRRLATLEGMAALLKPMES